MLRSDETGLDYGHDQHRFVGFGGVLGQTFAPTRGAFGADVPSLSLGRICWQRPRPA